jgi:hypothetical protein
MLIKGYYIEAEEVMTTSGGIDFFDIAPQDTTVLTVFDIRDVMSIRQVDDTIPQYSVIEIGMGNPRLFKIPYEDIKVYFLNRDSI